MQSGVNDFQSLHIACCQMKGEGHRELGRVVQVWRGLAWDRMALRSPVQPLLGFLMHNGFEVKAG